MKQIMLFILVILAILTSPITANAFKAQKVEVLDGDTVRLRDISNGIEFKVRLFCIDAPEKDQLNGMKSKDHLDKIMPAEVDVVPLGGSYDRIVAVLTNDQQVINSDMVKDGYAWVYLDYCKTSHKTELVNLQNQAQFNKIGIWESDNNIPPWEWRKQHRKQEKE